MKRFSLAIIALLSLAAVTAAAKEGRTITNFDANWKFTLGDPAAASSPSFNDRAWRTLDLPHDWSIEGEADENEPGGGRVGYFPTGTGWYRKSFSVPGFSRSKLYSIEFDGVYMNSEVWLNGHRLGKWPYGYTSFSYDLTPYLKARGNVIAVRVDNSEQPNSRWYTGSGIYRHVRLVETSATHFAKWGIFARTEKVENGVGVLRIDAAIEGPGTGLILRNELRDAAGKVVARDERAAGSGDNAASLTVPAAHLWALDDPYLYTLESYIVAGGVEIDHVSTPVGIRTLLYDVNKGFFLNGVHIKMFGVNLHHDGGAVGAAVPERVWERRFELLKESGCNAIRTAHNIPAPEFLDLCDRMGFLVMDEAFDMWVRGKNEQDYHVYFDDWHTRDLSCMVLRDRNHPSVVIWSIGNEIPDQDTEIGDDLAREMIALCHRLDDSRLVTSGNDHIAADGGRVTPEFLEAFENDIVGYNYPDRWRERKETNYTEDKIEFPNRRVVATESGGLSGTRVTNPNPVVPAGVRPGRGYGAGAASTRFIDTEQRWRYALINDFVIGDFMWTGIDYYGEARWPSRGFTSGYLDNCGFKKDGFYFFQSIWTDKPVLHLAGGWDYGKEKEGQIMQVVVFTNCSEVELFVNGRSYGRKTREFPRYGMKDGWGVPQPGKVSTSTADLHLAWDVEYMPGEIKLVGTRRGETFTEVVKTPGAPASLRLSVDRPRIQTDPSDVAHVTVEILDKDGNLVTSAANHITFSAPGARIIGVENGNMTDKTKVKAAEKDAYGGMALAILQADKAGTYTVTASADGLGSASVSFTAE